MIFTPLTVYFLHSICTKKRLDNKSKKPIKVNVK